ncbi:MAG: hypothetical protein ACP5IT_11315, partial [Thermoproteota archaeon]
MRKLTRALVSLALALLLLVTEYPIVYDLLPKTYAQPTLPTIPILLWKASQGFYMSKIVGDYVIGFTSHGDVSLDGKYISTYGNAYVYNLKTGTLIRTLTGPGTFTFGGTKVYANSGFFSADGTKMIEDVDNYDTNAKLVDTSTWTATTVNWGFTDTTTLHLYAVQLDYSGNVIIAGYIYKSRLLVYRGGSLVFNWTESGNYGRRIQSTLDGNTILIGGLNYGYLDIWTWTGSTYTRTVHYALPDTGGIGALGISDPWNVGYVVIGTYNGYVIIGKYSGGSFSVIFQKKMAKDSAWFYNPFYNRWIPAQTPVLALSSKAGVSVIYDTETNTYMNVTVSGTAESISADGSYVFLGDSLYALIKRDPQSGNPRLRMEGYTYATDKYIPDTSKPIVYSAPQKDWHAYFFGGSLVVKTLMGNPIPKQLITDNDVLNGKLGNMANKGLISTNVMETDSADVKSVSLVSQDVTPTPEEIQTYGNIPTLKAERTIIYSASQNLYWKGYLWDSHVTSGVTIKIPLGTPVAPYSNLTLASSFGVLALALTTDNQGNAVWGTLLGLGLGNIFSGASLTTVGSYLVKKFGGLILTAFKNNIGINIVHATSVLDKLAVVGTSAVEVAGSQYGLATIAGTAFSLVGAVLIVDGIADIAYATVLPPSSKLIYITFPIFVDTVSGAKYTAVTFVVPQSEAGEVSSVYYPLVQSYASKLGVTVSGYQVVFMGADRKEYMQLIASGAKPTINLLDLAKIVSNAQNVPLNRLQIQEIGIVIDVRTTGRSGLVQSFLGGVQVPVGFVVYGQQFAVEGQIASFSTSNPTEIADKLGKAVVNGQEYKFIPTPKGAKIEFGIPDGAEGLSIQLPSGYSAIVDFNSTIVVKKDLSQVGDFGYNVSLHYDWDTLIRLSKIEFLDMPYPMNYSERTFFFREGQFTHPLSKYFTLVNKTADPKSPTGWRYYYMSTDPTLFDPANGGMLQPCKTFKVDYYYKAPPDVSINILLNGTNIVSTLARHASL